MKLTSKSLLGALALALACLPCLSRADYQPPSMALAKLERIVNLTSAQKAVAYKIFDNLKEIMDDIPAAERPEKGQQSRQDAIAAIRSILTPDQQAIYDKTPQRLGGGSTKGDPAMAALRLKIHTFVADFAKTSPAVAAQIGVVKRAVGMSPDTTTSNGANGDDPALHPSSGTNFVQVTGGKGTETIKVYWTMTPDGVMTVTKFEKTTK